MHLLDVPTLFHLLDADTRAVQHTIMVDGWSGGLWPDHPEWNDHADDTRVFSLAVHYFSVRHPPVDRPRVAAAAQLLASHASACAESHLVEEDPIYQQAQMWLWAMVGAIPGLPGSGVMLAPVRDDAQQVCVPGGDVVAFTHAAVAMIEALIFPGVDVAQNIVEGFLRSRPDHTSQRAMAVFRAVLGEEGERLLDADITCVQCGAVDLQTWYTGQTWGEILCADCYDRRVRTVKTQD